MKKGQGQNSWVFHNSKLYCETTVPQFNGEDMFVGSSRLLKLRQDRIRGTIKITCPVFPHPMTLGDFPFAYCTVGKGWVGKDMPLSWSGPSHRLSLGYGLGHVRCIISLRRPRCLSCPVDPGCFCCLSEGCAICPLFSPPSSPPWI